MQFKVSFERNGGAFVLVEAEFYDMTNQQFAFYAWDGKAQRIVEKFKKGDVARVEGFPTGI